MKIALTIAGSDSSGGAGIQADLKTFQALGVFGVTVLTAITAQNTQKVYSVQEVSPDIIKSQILCLFEDMPVDVIKVGMLLNSRLAIAVSETLKTFKICPIVLDPVMVSKSGYHLLDNEARKVLIKELIPMSFVVTPNLYEAAILVGSNIRNIEDMKMAAKRICSMGAKNVVIKGGHLKNKLAVDVAFDGRKFSLFEAERLKTVNTHGTGCTFSSAIAANLAKGKRFLEAVSFAKDFITGAIKHAPNIGKGCGPTDHFFDIYRRAGIET